ncbi:hypothetical protein [Haliscomenobacter sp.]
MKHNLTFYFSCLVSALSAQATPFKNTNPSHNYYNPANYQVA